MESNHPTSTPPIESTSASLINISQISKAYEVNFRNLHENHNCASNRASNETYSTCLNPHEN